MKKRKARYLSDDAERWLKANDPEYKTRKRAWQTPHTDALSQDTVPFESQLETSSRMSGETDFVAANPGHEHMPFATMLYDTADYDVKVRPGRIGKREQKRQLLPQARALVAAGMSKRGAAQMLGVKWQTLQRWLAGP